MPASVESARVERRDVEDMLFADGPALRAVLAGCGDCIKILDLEGRLQFMSEGGQRVMEVDDFHPLRGCPWPDFWAGEGHVNAKAAVERARQGQSSRFRGAADTMKGSPRYWDVQVSPILGSDDKPTHLLSISRDITTEWDAEQRLKEAAERQRLLTEEMIHRINNTFAIVAAIARQTIRGDDVDAAREAFGSRLISLGNANRVLLQSGGLSGSIKTVVEVALEPHRPGLNRIRIDGPNFSLLPKQALSLALALHELATNAMKYGALSTATGVVDILWKTDDLEGQPTFILTWEENGGPTLDDHLPRRTGFGSRLIHQVFPKDFGGTIRTLFQPSGFKCELQAPFCNLGSASL